MLILFDNFNYTKTPMNTNNAIKRFVALTLLCVMSLFLVACSVDTTPRIDSFAVERVLDQAEKVSLSAKVTDPNNDLKSVVVSWGDGTSEEVISNFQAIQLTHSYAELGKTYTVELVAEDLLAAKVSDTRPIGIATIARSCKKITEIEFCYDIQPDLLTAKITVKAFDNTLYEETLSASMPSVEFLVPVAGSIGQAKVKLTGDFSANGGENSVQVQVFACAFGLICTGEIANEKIIF